MSISETIATASLFVSIVSAIYTIRSSVRASRRIDAIEEKPVFWLELVKLAEDTWRATIKVRNRTRYSIRLDALVVDVERVPVDKFQSFILGDYDDIAQAVQANPADAPRLVQGRDTFLKMGLPQIVVNPDETTSVQAVLYRGKASGATNAKILVHYYVLKERPVYGSQTVTAPLGGNTLTFKVDRV